MRVNSRLQRNILRQNANESAPLSSAREIPLSSRRAADLRHTDDTCCLRHVVRTALAATRDRRYGRTGFYIEAETCNRRVAFSCSRAAERPEVRDVQNSNCAQYVLYARRKETGGE